MNSKGKKEQDVLQNITRWVVKGITLTIIFAVIFQRCVFGSFFTGPIINTTLLIIIGVLLIYVEYQSFKMKKERSKIIESDLEDNLIE